MIDLEHLAHQPDRVLLQLLRDTARKITNAELDDNTRALWSTLHARFRDDRREDVELSKAADINHVATVREAVAKVNSTFKRIVDNELHAQAERARVKQSSKALPANSIRFGHNPAREVIR